MPIASRKVVTVPSDCTLPTQEIHAVYPSPLRVPAKVTARIAFLQEAFQGEWWLRTNPAASPAGN